MFQVGIVTDSVTGLPEDLIKEYHIRTVSMGFVWNNRVYRDYQDITMEEFWKVWPTFRETPTTSACSPGDFLKTFQDLSRETNQIVCITISNVLSATHKAACQAAQMIKEEKPGLEVTVIDSQTSACGLGWIVLEAARAARAGKSQLEVIETVRNMMGRSKYILALESLKYVMKIGRAPDGTPQQAPPKISPIMGIVKANTGVMENLDRAANIDEALAKLIDIVKNHVDTSKPVHFLLTYPDRREKCEQIQKNLSDKYQCEEILIGQWTPSAMVATGPMYGLGFYV